MNAGKSMSRWSIAIFTARETLATLAETVAAVELACVGASGTIDVIVNGNRGLAAAIAESRAANSGRARPSGARLRVWFIAEGDKAHAWNQYIESIAPESDVVFFVDGYARVTPDSLHLLEDAFVDNPEAWAASAVPTVGRSAKRLRGRMQTEGGIHGSLYALRGSVVELLRSSGVRLPIGIYRNDSLLGAIMCFSADPGSHRWNAKRIAVVRGATWTHEALRWTRWASVVTQWKRLRRQAQGVLENAAVRQHLALDRLPPESLPGTAAELIARWRAAHPADALALLRHPLRRRAARQLALPRDWSLAERAPELLLDRKPAAD